MNKDYSFITQSISFIKLDEIFTFYIIYKNVTLFFHIGFFQPISCLGCSIFCISGLMLIKTSVLINFFLPRLIKIF